MDDKYTAHLCTIVFSHYEIAKANFNVDFLGSAILRAVINERSLVSSEKGKIVGNMPNCIL